jgi:hypothetical protein
MSVSTLHKGDDEDDYDDDIGRLLSSIKYHSTISAILHSQRYKNYTAQKNLTIIKKPKNTNHRHKYRT